MYPLHCKSRAIFITGAFKQWYEVPETFAHGLLRSQGVEQQETLIPREGKNAQKISFNVLLPWRLQPRGADVDSSRAPPAPIGGSGKQADIQQCSFTLQYGVHYRG